MSASKARGHWPLCQVGGYRRSIDVLTDYGYRVVTQEGRTARDHFVQHGSQRVQVGLWGDFPAHGLFRRHV